MNAPEVNVWSRHLLGAAVVCALLLAAVPAWAADEPQWIKLFNGKNLNNWEQHGGVAEYRVEDGCVVGKTVAGTPNSFMCTKRRFGDFVLEFEFNVPEGMNSGVQFRSQVFDAARTVKLPDGKTKEIPADRVHGYQYEIDPSPRAYTGGVYDEGRRGWLQDLSMNEAARKAFKPGEWNVGRIECRGDSIKTFINGVPAAEFTDSLTPRGLIALQVHGIGNKGMPGQEVRWRNIRLQVLDQPKAE